MLDYPRASGRYSVPGSSAEAVLSLHVARSVHQLWQDVALAAAAAVPLALLFARRHRAARAVAGIVLAAGFAAFLLKYSFSFSPELLGYFIPQWLPLLLMVAGFHSGAPLPSARKWWLALTGVTASALYFGFFGESELRGLSWFRLGGGTCHSRLLRVPATLARVVVLARRMLFACAGPAISTQNHHGHGRLPGAGTSAALLVGAGIVALIAAGIVDYRRQII